MIKIFFIVIIALGTVWVSMNLVKKFKEWNQIGAILGFILYGVFLVAVGYELFSK